MTQKEATRSSPSCHEWRAVYQAGHSNQSARQDQLSGTPHADACGIYGQHWPYCYLYHKQLGEER